MDETDFSEDTTYKQQEDLPYDGDLSQMNTGNDYNFTSKSDVPDISNQVIVTGDVPQEEATQKDTCRKTAVVTTWDKVTENAANEKCDGENQCAMTPHIPAHKGDSSKSNISNILLHHLSKEQFLIGSGIDCETLPEISNADSLNEAAIIKNISSHYIKNSCPKEQTIELTDQPDPKRNDGSSHKPSCSATTTENPSGIEELVAAGDRSHRENFNFLTQVKGLSDKQKNRQGQTPQKQPTDKASAGSGFKYDQGQVRSQLLDFSKVVPKVKIPKSHMINKPLILTKRASSSPKLRNKSANVQESLETMSRSNCVEKHHLQQERKSTESTEASQQIQMEPTVHSHQELLTGIQSETRLLKLSSTSQKDPSLSSSYIFQKISQGKQMCQKLKEQTDQLKTKVQEFSKRIKEDSFCHLQDRILRVSWFSSSRQASVHIETKEVEGEIFKLEMLLEDVKEKTDESNCTSALSLPESFPVILDDLASIASSLSNEGDPSGTRGRLEREEAMGPSPSCAFCNRLLEWKQKMERKGHRRINCGGFSIVIREKARHQAPARGSDSGPGSCSDSDAGPQSDRCGNCGTQIHSSPRVCSKEPLKDFHYRYNTPGQTYLNHSRRSAFVQPCSLDENKSFSPPCSKPKQICSQRVNSKSFQDEHEPTPGKKYLKTFMTYSSDLATPPPHFHSCRISGSKSLCDFNSTEETESKILNSALDHALKTATILKTTTDQMIKAIAEDLAKAQRWRNRLKYCSTQGNKG